MPVQQSFYFFLKYSMGICLIKLKKNVFHFIVPYCMLTAIFYFFLAPPSQTTLPTIETVLMPPAFLRMLIELDSSHNLLYFITKRIFSRHFDRYCSSCQVLAYLLMTFDSIYSVR